MTDPLRETIERLFPHLAEGEQEAVADFARAWVALAGEIASTEHRAALTEENARPTLEPRSIIYKPRQEPT